MKKLFALVLMSIIFKSTWAQNNAAVTESLKTYTTYPFHHPDPTAPSKTIYPYYRFNGFTDQPIQKEWKTVVLENDFLRVTILPEIGGKIWDAVDKKTGHSFLYNNEVVKFRDIAMRGPWTSGGIEPNYGIIGHTPNCATPVDYLTRTNADGSVSCFIGTLDLLTQTWWTIEIRLPKENAWFTTRSFWQNNNALEQPYYTWMNTGLPASDDLEFVYPGNHYLGHEGEFASWPLNLREHKNISRYANNDFGSYKSYHVFGRYTNFFGAYWHKANQGMGRYSLHDEKAGKKIWIWGLSRQGMIWEKLLTDTNGQYVEVQSGRLFNQTGDGSSRTPFKHFGFEPYQTDTWTEYWFPVHGTNGFVYGDPDGALNVQRKGGQWHLSYQALGPIDGALEFISNGSTRIQKKIKLTTQEIFRDSVLHEKGNLEIYLKGKLIFENQTKDGLSRPLESPGDFDWSSAYGFWLLGKEAERSRNYAQAEKNYRTALERDRHFVPALAGIAGLFIRKGDYPRARVFAMRGLAVDTYDADCNYAFAQASAAMGNKADAKDGFDIAALSTSHRTAAYTQLSKWYLGESLLDEAIHYANRALETNTSNSEALQVQLIAYRLKQDQGNFSKISKMLLELNPLNHFPRIENWISSGSAADKKSFQDLIRNELTHETFLHYANWYAEAGRWSEAEVLLDAAPAHTEIAYWKAWLNFKQNKPEWKALLEQANGQSTRLVFPFRLRSREVFEWAESESNHWKTKYYQALIQHHLDLPLDAQELIAACGDEPNEAAFYSLRAELKPEGAEKDFQKAITLEPEEWIFAKKLFDILVQKEKWTEALTLAQQYSKKYPLNGNLTMMHAKALMLTGKYSTCTTLLTKSTILPYEGSTEARQIYWHSWMLQAVDQLKNKKSSETLRSIQQAMTWPENLGVGQPYEAELDLRPEWLMQYMAFTKQGKKSEAEALSKKIRSRIKQETSMGKWSLVLLDKLELGKDEAAKSLGKWTPTTADQIFKTWCNEQLGSSGSIPTPKSEHYRLAAGLFSLTN